MHGVPVEISSFHAVPSKDMHCVPCLDPLCTWPCACPHHLKPPKGPCLKDLAALESREVRIAAAEEKAVLEADMMCRDAATRRRDAEGAVRRLQEELQHALELERARTAEEVAGAAVARDGAAAARRHAEEARFALRAWREAESESLQQQVRSLVSP
jgi:hypothetical protein